MGCDRLIMVFALFKSDTMLYCNPKRGLNNVYYIDRSQDYRFLRRQDYEKNRLETNNTTSIALPAIVHSMPSYTY